ncbi:hypothetical protein [Gaiella occulta]|nr:hypothetical protein [Gaiella occulta]
MDTPPAELDKDAVGEKFAAQFEVAENLPRTPGHTSRAAAPRAGSCTAC